MRKAQRAAAARAEFAGTVAFVETHDFVRKPEDSPNPTHGHHEFGNAETYLLVGDALAGGMLKLLGPAATPRYRSASVEGWTVRIQESVTGRNTEYGYPNNICTDIPPY